MVKLLCSVLQTFGILVSLLGYANKQRQKLRGLKEKVLSYSEKIAVFSKHLYI